MYMYNILLTPIERIVKISKYEFINLLEFIVLKHYDFPFLLHTYNVWFLFLILYFSLNLFTYFLFSDSISFQSLVLQSSNNNFIVQILFYI